MSDVKSAPHIESTTLADGVTIRINDHVYIAPEHLGEPYYVGRIMEFCTSHKSKGLQVRLAWFNRPKDVINRNLADRCLLVATMHSDINLVSSIRGKCVVTHKHYITKDQLEDYRKKEDHFYYNQLYDRYIQRVYDVVPCEIVQNVPTDILEALKERYQFIIVEQGKASDLTVARRICCICQEWCSSTASVKCAACHKSYHMACLKPPLARKPPKGFAWQCALCTRQEVLASSPSDSDVSNQNDTNKNTPKKRQIRATRSQLPKSRAQPQQQIITSTSLTSAIKPKASHSKKMNSQKIRMTNMWPFRYFGVNTNMGDILDVDDRIYPRAKSRIGPKYQANVADWPTITNSTLSPVSETNSLSSNKNNESKKNEKKGKSQRSSSKRSIEVNSSTTSFVDEYRSPEQFMVNSVRGTEDTVTCIYRPDILNDEQLDDYMNQVKKLNNVSLASHSSDLMDRALQELEQSQYHTDIAFEKMARLDQNDFNYITDWSKQEIYAFEQSIREHGHDLNYAKKSVGSKPMADIVRYFYQWKKSDRYEPVYSEWTKIFKPMKKFKSSTQKKTSNKAIKSNVENNQESDPTIVPRVTYTHNSYQCMNCLTKKSVIWRRSPSDTDRKRKVFKEVLCNDCGIYWLKYAKAKPIPEPIKRANSQGNASIIYHTQHGRVTTICNTANITTDSDTLDPLQKRKRNDGIPSKISVKKLKEEKSKVQLKFEPEECKVCLQIGPEDRLYTCYDCGMSVHNDCYGIESTNKEGWICDPCSNKINPMASYVYECVLCFKSSEESRQPLKMTSGHQWAHVQCAAFIPEIKFVHPKTLSTIEYIGCVNSERLDAICQICKNINGACVACTECKRPVHVQCAIDQKFKLAFEIQSPTVSEGGKAKVSVISPGLFYPSSPSGLMIPQVWCPTHNVVNLKLIELNMRTLATQESCIMTYAKSHKTITKGTTPAMRRFRQVTYYTYHSSNQKHRHRHPKIPNAWEAALEALNMAEVPTLDQYTSIALPSKKTILLTNLPKQVCATKGCSVQHTPIWWSVEGNPDKKICQKCHNLRS